MRLTRDSGPVTETLVRRSVNRRRKRKSSTSPRGAIGNIVDPLDLVVFEGGLHRRIVHLLEVVGGDPPEQVVVLGALQPPGHGVAADDRGGQERTGHMSILSREARCKGWWYATLAGNGRARSAGRSPRGRRRPAAGRRSPTSRPSRRACPAPGNRDG